MADDVLGVETDRGTDVGSIFSEMELKTGKFFDDMNRVKAQLGELSKFVDKNRVMTVRVAGGSRQAAGAAAVSDEVAEFARQNQAKVNELKIYDKQRADADRNEAARRNQERASFRAHNDAMSAEMRRFNASKQAMYKREAAERRKKDAEAKKANDAAIREADRASRRLQKAQADAGLGRSKLATAFVGTLGGAVGRVGQAAAFGGAIAAAAAGVYLLGRNATEAYIRLDSLERGMTAISGSAEVARLEISRLKEVAKLPGLGFEEAIQGSINLQAAGLSAKMAKDTLMAFGNALATVGKGKAELEGVQIALTQILSKGKVQGDEILQLMERVPQIGEVIRKAFGTANTEELAKMGVSAQEFIAKVVQELGKLPKVTGGVRNDFENLRDAVTQALDNLGRAISPAVGVVVAGLARMSDAFAGIDPSTQQLLVFAAGMPVALAAINYLPATLSTVAGGWRVVTNWILKCEIATRAFSKASKASLALMSTENSVLATKAATIRTMPSLQAAYASGQLGIATATNTATTSMKAFAATLASNAKILGVIAVIFAGAKVVMDEIKDFKASLGGDESAAIPALDAAAEEESLKNYGAKDIDRLQYYIDHLKDNKRELIKAKRDAYGPIEGFGRLTDLVAGIFGESKGEQWQKQIDKIDEYAGQALERLRAAKANATAQTERDLLAEKAAKDLQEDVDKTLQQLNRTLYLNGNATEAAAMEWEILYGKYQKATGAAKEQLRSIARLVDAQESQREAAKQAAEATKKGYEDQANAAKKWLTDYIDNLREAWQKQRDWARDIADSMRKTTGEIIDIIKDQIKREKEERDKGLEDAKSRYEKMSQLGKAGAMAVTGIEMFKPEAEPGPLAAWNISRQQILDANAKRESDAVNQSAIESLIRSVLYPGKHIGQYDQIANAPEPKWDDMRDFVDATINKKLDALIASVDRLGAPPLSGGLARI